MKKICLLFAVFLFFGSLSAQKKLGEFYTLSEMEDGAKKTMTFRLDSIVGDAHTGWLTFYFAISGNKGYQKLLWFGFDQEYTRYTKGIYYSLNCSDKTWRNVEIKDFIHRKTDMKTLPFLTVSFHEYSFQKNIYLQYKDVPIIWHSDCQPAMRPAEFYISSGYNKLSIFNGTKVIPYCGTYTKNQNRPDQSDYSEAIDLRLSGLVGNKVTGEVFPIFNIYNKSHNNFTYLKSIEIYDENGEKHEIKNRNSGTFPFFTPIEKHTEISTLSFRTTPDVQSIQKITFTLNYPDTEYWSDYNITYVFIDIPILWVNSIEK